MLRVKPYSSFSYASPTIYSSEALVQFKGLQRSLGALVQFRGSNEFKGSSVLLTLSVQPTQPLAYSLGALILQYIYFSAQLSPLFTSPQSLVYLVFTSPLYQLATFFYSFFLATSKPLTSLYISSYLLSSKVNLYRIQRQFYLLPSL